MPRDRADDLLQGPRSEPVRGARLRLSLRDDGRGPAESSCSTTASTRACRCPRCPSIRSSSVTSAATPTGSRMLAARPAWSTPCLPALAISMAREYRCRRAGFRFSRRLARHGRRRSGDHRHAHGGQARDAVHPVRRVRRRAHAGRHSLAHADAAHHRRRAGAARGEAALHRRADASRPPAA